MSRLILSDESGKIQSLLGRFNNTTAQAHFANGSRERNEVKRPDHPTFDLVTALRFVPGGY
ncbi:MAG: hypothetical protein FWC50_03885 [Planctomycetaceae bacterium]|nr:hypothetical protein [Planctomycetaceae bacterium]